MRFITFSLVLMSAATAAPAALSAEELVSVRVATEPPGARIFIDGLERGETPASLSLPAGAHDVYLYKRGLLPVRKKVDWAPGDRPIFKERMREQRGGLAVIVDPPGTQVYFDGRLLGESPLAYENLPAGSHVIELRKAGFTTERETVEISDAAVRELVMRLDGPPVGLFVEAEAGSRVFLDGSYAGEVTGDSLSLRVRAGTHELRIERNGFASVRQIMLEPGRDAVVGPGPMVRIPADPGERETARLNPRWYWVGASGVVALAGGVIAVRSALAAADAREAYESAFRRADVEDAKDRVKLQNVLIGVGAGVAVLGAAGVYFAWPAAEKSGVSLEVVPTGARVAWRFP